MPVLVKFADEYKLFVADFSYDKVRDEFETTKVEYAGSLKNEMIHHQMYATRENAEAAIKEYIEIFYKRQRRHSRLGYVSPTAFAENFRKQALAA